MAFLDIRGLSHVYGRTAALRDVSLNIDAGEFVVLVGPSGCGKSTLLNLVAGLERVQSGAIVIDGEDVTGRSPAERDIAMVFQSYALYPHMTVAENLAFGLRMRRVARAARAAAIAEVADLLKIADLMDRKPRELSGGQRQRVAMGRALVRKPRVFLFDEPLSNLDARLRLEMRSLIKRLHQQFKTTTVYVTHDQVEAMTLATRVAVMQGGRVHQVGPPQHVYAEPASVFVARFMGAPGMNLIDGVLMREGSRVGVEVALAEGARVTLPLPRPESVAGYPSAGVVLGLRPEAITAVQGAEHASLWIDNRVDVVEPTGADTFVVMRMGHAEVVARLPGDARVVPGAVHRFAIDMSRCVLFDPATELRIGFRP